MCDEGEKNDSRFLLMIVNSQKRSEIEPQTLKGGGDRTDSKGVTDSLYKLKKEEG